MLPDLKTEIEILKAVSAGARLTDICSTLKISQGQYYYFMALLKAKHGAKNAANLVAIAYEKKLLG